MPGKLEIIRAHRQNYLMGIAQITQTLESGHPFTTQELTTLLQQRKEIEVLLEASDLLIEKYDTSGAIELVTEEVNDTSSPTLDRNEEATPT